MIKIEFDDTQSGTDVFSLNGVILMETQNSLAGVCIGEYVIIDYTTYKIVNIITDVARQTVNYVLEEVTSGD